MAVPVENSHNGFEHRKQIQSRDELFQDERRLWRRSKSAAYDNPKSVLAAAPDGPDADVRNESADVVVRAAFEGDFDFARKFLKSGVLAQEAVSGQRIRGDVKNLVGSDARKRAAHNPAHHRTAGPQGRQRRGLDLLQEWHDRRGRHAGDFDSLPGGKMRAFRPVGLFGQAGNRFQLRGGQSAGRNADADDIPARPPAQAVNAVPHANALCFVSRARLGFLA